MSLAGPCRMRAAASQTHPRETSCHRGHPSYPLAGLVSSIAWPLPSRELPTTTAAEPSRFWIGARAFSKCNSTKTLNTD